MTGYEKWIHYDNPKRKKSWVIPGQPNIHGIIYFELLKPNETITGERYRTQLMRLSRVLKQQRPQYEDRQDKVILQDDNVRQHVARPLQWEVLLHPPYFPDIAPSDYLLFRSMTHGMFQQRFTSYEECQKWVGLWIASKDESFFRAGIRKLPERWDKLWPAMKNTLNNICLTIF